MISAQGNIRSNRDIFRSDRLSKVLKACIGKQLCVADLGDAVQGYSLETLRSDCKLLSRPSMGYMKEVTVRSERYQQRVYHYETIKPVFNIDDLEPIELRIKKSKQNGTRHPQAVTEDDPPWKMTVNERHVPRVDKQKSRGVAMGSSMNSIMW